jgi:3-hydroxyisobutyrate dehydrogenase-like beta-hydroxyacid dehydrogenase
MGQSMCKHLMDAGYAASVYNRTASKCQPLVDLGATLCATPREVAALSDVVFTIVGYPEDVRDVVLGEGHGVFAEGGLAPGGVLVDMTTSSPELAVEIEQVASSKGCWALDAPVSGGDIGAKAGTLAIMAGGKQEAFDRVLPMLLTMGKAPRLMGNAGAGQMTNAVNQTVIASSMVAMAEGLVLAHRSGLDAEQVIETIKGGAAGSFSLSQLGPRALHGDLEPGFKIDHFIKDLTIAIRHAEKTGVKLSGAALALDLCLRLEADGRGQQGTQALIAAVEAAGASGNTAIGAYPRAK